jgi:hypothetical protein
MRVLFDPAPDHSKAAAGCPDRLRPEVDPKNHMFRRRAKQAIGIGTLTEVSLMMIFLLPQENELLYSFARVDLTGI